MVLGSVAPFPYPVPILPRSRDVPQSVGRARLSPAYNLPRKRRASAPDSPGKEDRQRMGQGGGDHASLRTGRIDTILEIRG